MAAGHFGSRHSKISSAGNTQIDFTPLMDVLFLFLFVAIMGCAQLTREAVEASDKAVREREEVIEGLNEEIEALQKEKEELGLQLMDQDAVEGLYSETLEVLETPIAGGKVLPVTIYCTYDRQDYKKRTLRISAPLAEFDPMKLDPENQREVIRSLARILSGYIEAHDDAVIVLTLNRSDILRQDRLAIEDILYALTERYDYVY